jgi:hypothetical protein
MSPDSRVCALAALKSCIVLRSKMIDLTSRTYRRPLTETRGHSPAHGYHMVAAEPGPHEPIDVEEWPKEGPYPKCF